MDDLSDEFDELELLRALVVKLGVALRAVDARYTWAEHDREQVAEALADFREYDETEFDDRLDLTPSE